MNRDEAINGRLPYNIQCKSSTQHLPYGKLLAELPEDNQLNVIVHEHTRKVGNRFLVTGTYALLPFTDFLDLIRHATETGYKPNYESDTTG